jgi:integrase
VKVSKRRGAWVVDYYDFGKRRVKAFPTKRDAEDFAADTRKKQQQRVRPTVDAHITVKEFSTVFLERCKGLGIKPRTIDRYEGALRVHIEPALGDKRVRDLDRPTVEAFIIAKRNETESRQGQRGADMEGRRKLAKGTVLHLLMTLSGLMRAAIAVQLLPSNPLSGLTKDLRLSRRRKGERGRVKAFDQGQLVRFLVMAREHAPDVFPAFAVMGLAGLRVGEAMGLKWPNVDLVGKRLHVAEQISGTTDEAAGTLKDGEERDVEIADALVTILRDVQAHHRQEAFRLGQPMPRYALFPCFEESTDRKAEQRVVKLIRRRMQRVLQLAGLPGHHTPHSLRHSFASILISKGKPIAYVQQALGHASISMTVDTYGSWLPVEAPGAVNVLAEGLSAALPVTNQAVTGNIIAEVGAQGQ